MAELTVGQKVRVLPYAYSTGRVRRTGRGLDTNVVEGEVTKIARVRVTIKVQGWEVQFDKNTGRECVRDFGRTFETDEQFAAREHRQDVISRLLELGIVTGHGRADEPPTPVLEGLLAVMEGTHSRCQACGNDMGTVCWRCA